MSPGYSFGLDHLLPSRVPIPRLSSPLDLRDVPLTSIEQSPTAQGAQRQRLPLLRTHTEDWVRQYRSGKWHSERGNWWSDGSVDSGSDLDDLETPKLPQPRRSGAVFRAVQRLDASPTLERRTSRGAGKGLRRAGRHRTREENLTLKQEDFLEVVRRGKRQRKLDEMSGLLASRWAPESEETLAKSEEEQDIATVDPTPPSSAGDDGMSQQEESSAAAVDAVTPPTAVNDAEVHEETTAELDPTRHRERSDTLQSLSVPRKRTKVFWRGKACWISVPKSTEGWLPPLSAAEVEHRLRELEEAGFSTAGFNLQEGPDTDGFPTTGKPEFPDPAEDFEQRQKKAYNVRIPDPNAWKAYQDFLIEQKLRALGVSLGDEPAASAPPSRPLSRTHRAFSPSVALPAMQPLGASQRTTPTLSRSPFNGPGHAHSASVISPGLAGPPGHMSRHSVFGLPGQPFGFSEQNAQPGLPAWSPNPQQFHMPGMPARGSPTMGQLKPDTLPAKPTSPLNQPPQISPSGMHGDWRAQAHQRQQSAFPTFPAQRQTPQLGIRPTPTLTEVAEEEEELINDYFEGVSPFTQPPPQPQQKRPEVAAPTPRGHRHNISETLEREIREAEYHLETQMERELDEEEAHEQNVAEEKKVAAKPLPETHIQPPTLPQSLAPNKLLDRAKGHKSKLSVAAPEFKFNPSTSFTFTSPGTDSQPKASNPLQPLSANINRPPGHSRKPSSGPNNYNVTAPVFQPTLSMPTSDFSFSAPTFQPGAGAFSYAPPPPVSTMQSSIFGDFQIPEVVKPAPRSKAVAIVKPASPKKEKEVKEEEREDENGRAVQSPERMKRAKFGRGDGDDVPLFAERPEEKKVEDATVEHRESGVPAVPLDSTAREPVQESDGSAVHKQVSSAEVSEAAPVFKETENLSSLGSGEQTREPSPQKYVPPFARSAHRTRSSLSALAKPFVFNAQHQEPAEETESDLSDGEIDEDLDTAKPDFSPARLFPQDQETPFKHGTHHAGPDPTKHVPYPDARTPDYTALPEPSFAEIDAVMQALNEEDDVQVDEHIRSVSPERGYEMGARLDHVPQMPTLRSDAPSPSPRRIETRPPVRDYSVSSLDSRFINGHTDLPSSGVHRLNASDNVPVSEWSDMPSDQESKLHGRTAFFDSRIDELVGSAVRDQLKPLEETLRLLQRSISSNATREPKPQLVRPSTGMESDADDEDDIPEDRSTRPTSRGKRAEYIKAAVSEAFAVHQASQAATNFSHLEDIRTVIETALDSQAQALVPLHSTKESEQHRRHVSELEGRLNETLAGAIEEANHRHAIEEREKESRRLLRLAEEELELLRSTVADKDQRIHALEQERDGLRDCLDDADSAQEESAKVADLEAENAALEATLDEYRVSSQRWRKEVDEGEAEREELRGEVQELKDRIAEGGVEQERLRRTVRELREQMAEGKNIRENMRARLDRIHADMANAAEQLANEKAAWRDRNEELKREVVVLQTRCEVETGERNRLEMANGRLEERVLELAECKMVAEAAKTRHELLLREEAELRHDAIRKVEETSNMALEDVRQRYADDVAAVKAQHARDLANAIEDKQRAEAHLAEQLDLSNAKLAHFEDRIAHLRERLQVAKDAAQAAVSSAKAAAKSTPPPQTQPQPEPATQSVKPSSEPEKISPQALRESILVLQEQLQDRESRIESLQATLTTLDTTAPAKLRERDVEIAWLRELLGVRADDLMQLIQQLDASGDGELDREGVRDTAIRIRTSLQMELAEKERLINAGNSLTGQALAGLTNFASPKAVQLAAAWGSWRRPKDSPSSASAATATPSVASSTPKPTPTPRSVASGGYRRPVGSVSALKSAAALASPRSVSETPSKPGSSSSSDQGNGHGKPSLFAGLMTPPASNLRRSPSPGAAIGGGGGTPQRPGSSYSAKMEEMVRRSAGGAGAGAAGAGKIGELGTPQLFGREGYDEDAAGVGSVGGVGMDEEGAVEEYFG